MLFITSPYVPKQSDKSSGCTSLKTNIENKFNQYTFNDCGRENAVHNVFFSTKILRF